MIIRILSALKIVCDTKKINEHKWEYGGQAMKSIFSLAILLVLCITFPGRLSAEASNGSSIRIGATVSMEGEYQEPSLMIQKSFQLWEQEVNQKGGLLGRKVELILYNDKSQVKTAKEMYRKLIEQDRVDFVFSPYGTPLTLAASEVSEQHKLLMLACAASGKVIWERGFRYIFGVYALADRYFIGLLDLMAQRGHHTVSLIYNDNSAFNVDVAKGAKKWAEKFKIRVVHEKKYKDSQKELPAIVSDLKAAKSERVIMSAYPPDCYRLLSEMKKNEYQPLVLGMTIAPIHPDFWENADGMAKRVFGPSQWEPSERIPFPGTKEFVNKFKHFSGKIPSYHAGSAYAACRLYEDAIRQTQSLDNEKIRNYISSLDTVTIIGRFKLNQAGIQIGHNPIIIQWQNGKKEIVWPFNMQTASPLL